MNYDFSKFHVLCGDRTVINSPDGLHVVCNKCGVSANLEAISAKVSPADACKTGDVERIPLGKQSANVDKGGIIQ